MTEKEKTKSRGWSARLAGGTLTDVCLLALFTLVFCLHYFHGRFIFQGDVFLNMYMHRNPDLFRLGWDPHGWDYLGWYPIAGVLFPLNVVMHEAIRLLDGSPLAVLHLLQLNAGVSLFLLALGTYSLLRHLGMSRLGAVGGACVVSFTGFHAAVGVRTFDLFYLHSFLFVPPVLMLLDRATRERRARWALWAGVLIGLSLLGGGNSPLFLYAFSFPIVVLLWGEGRLGARIWRSFLYTGLAFGVGLVVGSAMVVPSLKYMDHSVRASFMERAVTPIEPAYTAMTLIFRDWWPRGDAYQIPHVEFRVFLGLPVLLLALRGMVFGAGRGRAGVFMAFLGVSALCLMHLGVWPSLLSQPIIDILSSMSIRYPYRFFMVLLLPVAFFTARGLEAGSGRRSGLAWATFCLVSAAIFGIWSWRYWQTWIPPVLSIGVSAAMILSVAGAIAVGALGLPLGPTARRVAGGTAVIMVFALFVVSRPDIPQEAEFYGRAGRPRMVPVRYDVPVREAIRGLYEEPAWRWAPLVGLGKAPARITTRGTIRRGDVWAPRAGADVAFRMIGDPAAPLPLYNYYLASQGNPDSPLYDLYNIRFLELGWYGGSKLRPTVVPGIWENPYAFDRYFTVHGSRFLPSNREVFHYLSTMRRVMSAESFRKNLRSEVLLEGTGPSRPGSGGAAVGKDVVMLRERSTGRVALEVDMAAHGYLVASELWFPEWRVEVDGVQVPLLRAYGTFQAVELAGGEHNVVFTFFDRYAFWGRVISGVSMLAALGVVVAARVRRKRAI